MRARPVGIVAAGPACPGLGAARASNAKPTQHRRITRKTSRAMPIVYIGLGANLGDREATIRTALELLVADGDVEVDAVSSLRETDPVGFDPDYWRRGADLGWTSLLVQEAHGGGSISGAGRST